MGVPVKSAKKGGSLSGSYSGEAATLMEESGQSSNNTREVQHIFGRKLLICFLDALLSQTTNFNL